MIVSAISGVESLKCREKTSPERQLKCLMHTALRHHGGVYHFTMTYIFSFQVVLDDNMKPGLSCPHGVETFALQEEDKNEALPAEAAKAPSMCPQFHNHNDRCFHVLHCMYIVFNSCKRFDTL